MRYLVVSDIHANIEAFTAVLDAAPRDTWDAFVVLGDLVGYGAEPNAVIDKVRELAPVAVIRGNHDKAACGLDDGSNFNQIARYAAAWTGDTLTPDNREYLRVLPPGPIALDDRVEICHGSPFDEDHYIFDAQDARRALESTRHRVCLFGHTHLPVVFAAAGGKFRGTVPDVDDLTVTLEDAVRYLVNVGSVGQPRDGDPRAAFAVYDSDGPSIQLRRVAYPVQIAQRKISKAGLPQSLANRLAIGR
jgi:diadenosine tetraphosphatase ApaH/serine/threonine PP2A family protein phosphatase